MREGLLLFRELGDPMGISCALYGAAIINAEESQLARALCLGGAAQVLDEASGLVWPASFYVWIQQALEAARRSLGEEAAEAAWVQGRAMPLEQVMAEVLEEATMHSVAR